jgi:protease-4
MITAGLSEKIGLSSDEVHTSANATMWSTNMDFTSKQWTKFDQQLDWIYEDFTNKVAQGRGMSKDQVSEIARGRIWTGEDAKAIGLVDELGGFPVALRLAKEAAGIAEDAEVHVQVFPPELSLVQTLLASLQGEEDEGHAIGLALHRTAQQLQPLARLAQDLGLSPTPGVLSMPDWEMGREE